MNVDELLRSSAREVADSVAPPLPDLVMVRQEAHRRRTNLRAGVAAAAAVSVAAVALAAPSLVRETRPAPPEQAPGPTAIAPHTGPVWSDGRGIHLGTRVLDPGLDGGVRWLTLVSSGLLYGGNGGGVWFTSLDGDARRSVGQGATASGAVGNVNGSTAAWIEESGELVMLDTSTGRETARTALPPGVPADSRITFVGEMEVQYVAPASSWRYDRFTDTHSRQPEGLLDSTGRMRVVNGQTPVPPNGNQHRVTFTDNDGGTIGVYEPLQAAGRLSPSGLFYAALTPGPGRLEVVVVDTHTSHGDRLTDSPLRKKIGWGYGDTLMVSLLGSTGEVSELLACDASEDTCQTVAHLGEVVLPGS